MKKRLRKKLNRWHVKEQLQSGQSVLASGTVALRSGNHGSQQAQLHTGMLNSDASNLASGVSSLTKHKGLSGHVFRG